LGVVKTHKNIGGEFFKESSYRRSSSLSQVLNQGGKVGSGPMARENLMGFALKVFASSTGALARLCHCHGRFGVFGHNHGLAGTK
jgi:hypothetical protein